MLRTVCITLMLGALTSAASAQDYYGGCPEIQYGSPSVGNSEPLFPYDDQDPWKHGYLQQMPYYGGFHAFRPYNYKQVFAQSQVAAGWGMPNTMPYSQQFWHRYQQQTDLSQPQVAPTPVYQMPYGPQYGAPTQVPPPDSQPWHLPTTYAPPSQMHAPTAYAAPNTYESLPAASGEIRQTQDLRQYLRNGPLLP